MRNIIGIIFCFLKLHCEHHAVSSGMVSLYLNLKKVSASEAYCVNLNMKLFIESLELKHVKFKSCALIYLLI